MRHGSRYSSVAYFNAILGIYQGIYGGEIQSKNHPSNKYKGLLCGSNDGSHVVHISRTRFGIETLTFHISNDMYMIVRDCNSRLHTVELYGRRNKVWYDLDTYVSAYPLDAALYAFYMLSINRTPEENIYEKNIFVHFLTSQVLHRMWEIYEAYKNNNPIATDISKLTRMTDYSANNVPRFWHGLTRENEPLHDKWLEYITPWIGHNSLGGYSALYQFMTYMPIQWGPILHHLDLGFIINSQHIPGRGYAPSRIDDGGHFIFSRRDKTCRYYIYAEEREIDNPKTRYSLDEYKKRQYIYDKEYQDDTDMDIDCLYTIFLQRIKQFGLGCGITYHIAPILFTSYLNSLVSYINSYSTFNLGHCMISHKKYVKHITTAANSKYYSNVYSRWDFKK